MMIWHLFAVFLVSFFMCLMMTKVGARIIPLDQPNQRSMHSIPIPRGGGMGILAGMIVGVVVLGLLSVNRESGLVAMGSLLLAIVAWRDDRDNVPPAHRLTVQLFSAICLLWALFYQLPEFVPALSWWLILPLATVGLLVILWSINLYNFMDGMDSLATVMAIIGFASLAWFGWQAGQVEYVSLALTIVAACLGFLPFNIHPAKMFMGDVGSTLLGFWVAGFSLWGMLLELYPWWVPLLLFSPFWVDASATLIGRILRKENVLQAHKSHLYQRLVRLGLGQRKTLLLEIVLMLACALLAISAVDWPGRRQIALLIGVSIAYAGFFRIAALYGKV